MECVACDSLMNSHYSWLFKCGHCGMFASTLEAGAGRGIEGLEALRRENFKKIADKLEKISPLNSKSILEVGCAEGWFLDEAASRGMKIFALEPSKTHAEEAGKRFSVEQNFFPGSFEQANSLDFIIFNDVFEHLPEPTLALAHCEHLLKPGGCLILNLPVATGIFYHLGWFLSKIGVFSLLERLWQKGFDSPHLYYYKKTTLLRLVKKYSGLTYVKSFGVKTLTSRCLYQRIASSHPGLPGVVLTGLLTILIPLIHLFPKDVKVFIFKKKGA